MVGNKTTICIAGKNQCAIDVLDYLISNYRNKVSLLALPNKSDSNKDTWQKSFKKFAISKKIKLIKLKDLYKIRNLYLFSIEYEKILKIYNFKSSNLFNIHFSLLPKYRGCHTNFYQIYKGEKYSGVTLHKIDDGIDTGEIISKIKFKIPINCTAYDNYLKLMRYSVIIFKKNIRYILNNNYNLKKQNINKGSYFSRKSVNYADLLKIKRIDNKIKTHNLIRSLIFEPFQLPIYNNKKIIKSTYKNNLIKIKYQNEI
tara:strand:+ start:3924 stop:4694 length:771 start_codon:yes stop_codon:yes gene_type:complete